MKAFFQVPILVLAAAGLSACGGAEQMLRNAYEGMRSYNKAVESTPLQISRDELPAYDEYRKERLQSAAKRSD